MEVKFPIIGVEFCNQIRSIAPIIPTFPVRGVMVLTVDRCIMLTTLCTLLCYFVYNYTVVWFLAVATTTKSILATTYLPLLVYVVNINLCGIVYSVFHRVIIIFNGCGSTHLD